MSMKYASQRAPDAACGYPLRLEPVFVERVWGAPMDSDAVAALCPSRPSQPRRVGEVWLTGNDSRIANGAHAGKTLGELAQLCDASLLGKNAARHPSGRPVFPLLVKFLFTTDKLSVQVHPPDSVAHRESSWGTTEMWHVLRAAPGARLAIGFRDALPEEAREPHALREAAMTGAIEHMLDWREVQTGETFFVPAGTVHAIGVGLTLCEIQQNSDITYRLYDYNRPGTDGMPRPLHLDEALKVIEWRTPGGRSTPFPFAVEGGPRTLLAACPYFATERWELRQPLERESHGRPEIWIALQGAAEFEAGGECAACSQGEVVVIPADASAYRVRPHQPSVFLRTVPPDWEKDVLTPLRAAGVSQDQMQRLCFPLSRALEGVPR